MAWGRKGRGSFTVGSCAWVQDSVSISQYQSFSPTSLFRLEKEGNGVKQPAGVLYSTDQKSGTDGQFREYIIFVIAKSLKHRPNI